MNECTVMTRVEEISYLFWLRERERKNHFESDSVAGHKARIKYQQK